jgi:hypothetical protein
MSSLALRIRAGTPMSLSSRILRRSVLYLLGTVSGVCAAQQTPQFTYQPGVELTGGRVTSLQTGVFQNPTGGMDILYINAPTGSGSTTSVVAGAMLNGYPTFAIPGGDKITFTNVSNVVAALADFDGDLKIDFAFTLTPSGSNATNLCVYYGTGATAASTNQNGVTSYDTGNIGLPNAYPPVGGKSGCMTFPVTGPNPPNFAYIAAFPFATGLLPQLLIEDSNNNLLYIFSNNGATGNNGVLTGFKLMYPPLPLADGAGPIYTGDFNGDGKTDFIINGQTNHTATVYMGNGLGTFVPQPPLTFGGKIHSMLMQDMDLDGKVDMVVEGDNGVITIHKGNGDGTFVTAPEGSISPGLDGFSGNGGHLVAINPTTLDILTTTPIGLSVLHNQGSLNYSLKNIYNIGSGRSSFALADFYRSGYLDLAVDSPEGVAIVKADGNGSGTPDGGFQTSLAYSALAPALGATVGQFRPLGNPVDVVVSTGIGAIQAQWLKGNGDGTFTAAANPTNTSIGPSNIPPNLWSNILSDDFNGGNLDIAYSLTGFPLPAPGTGTGSGLYIQYGKGDGTFQDPVAVTPLGAPSSNNFYGESAVGDFNGDGIADIANTDLLYNDTLLGQKSGSFKLGLNAAGNGNQDFNVVATGHFAAGASNKPADLLVQSGASLIPYVNNGDGIHFNAMPAIIWPLQAGTILLTDVNGDGNADIVALSYNSAANPQNPDPTKPDVLMIFYGNGDGTFGQPVTTSTPGLLINLSRNYYLAAVADMNGDGLPDIVLSDGYLVSILYNQGGQGNGSFVSDFGTQCSPCGEAHFLAGQGINSLSLQNVRGSSRPDLIVANGGATISYPPVLLGNKGLPSISLAANPDVNTGGITVLLDDITTQPVTGLLTSTPNPSGLGSPFTITATLTPTPGVAVPTGTVTFNIDGVAIPGCTFVNVTSGPTSSTAQCIVPLGNTYPIGTHPLTAYYGGDGVNSPENLTAVLPQSIVGATTTTTLYLCVGPSVSCPSTGSVPVPPLPFPTQLSMIYGQIYNGTATVTPSDSNPVNGNINIYDAYNGAAPALLCSLVASSGGACPATVGTGAQAGAHVITATYVPLPADTIHSGSSSTPVTITVAPDTPTVTITSSLNPAPQGQAVTLTATLAGPYAPLGTAASPVGLYVPPTGTVVFLYGSTQLCSSPLSVGSTGVNSIATCTTSTLPVGTDSITASYAATTDFLAATSAAFPETITPLLAPSFTITVTPNPVSIGVGYAALLTVTVTPQNGFTEGVNLACGNLPSEATCIFTTTAIAGGGGTSALIVETTAPHSCGATQPYFLGGNGGGPGLAPFALPALAGLIAVFVPGKRRWLRALLAVLLAAGAMQITGCGNCTDLGTRPGTHTFQVTGTSTGTSAVQSETVTLNITI